MTCETCGYIPWPGERGCASCQEIEDKKWAAAAPEALMKITITHHVKESDRIGTVRFSDGRCCQYLRDLTWNDVQAWFCDFGSNRKLRTTDKRLHLIEDMLKGHTWGRG